MCSTAFIVETLIGKKKNSATPALNSPTKPKKIMDFYKQLHETSSKIYQQHIENVQVDDIFEMIDKILMDAASVGKFSITLGEILLAEKMAGAREWNNIMFFSLIKLYADNRNIPVSGNPNEYNTNTRLDWSAPQKSENKCEELEGRCRDLANLCRFAGVPQVMIDNPRLINKSHLTKEDMAWATKKILELEKKKD